MPLFFTLKYLLLTGFLLNFSFKEEREIKVPFSSDKLIVLKDKLILFSQENLYFLNQRGDISFSIPIFGFEKGKVSEFVDFDRGEESIFILGKDKVLRYNLYGEFLSEFNLNLPSPYSIGVSFPFGIFVFDNSLYKIFRYDFDGRKKGEFFVEKGEIKNMGVERDFVYLYYKDGRIIIYNFYGNKVKELKLAPGNKIKIVDDLIFLRDNKNLKVFEREKEIYSENIIANDFYVDNENLYILLRDKIQIRRFER